MKTIDALFRLRHSPLDVPLVLYVPELGIAVEVVSVRADDRAYIAADGAICRGSVVALECAQPVVVAGRLGHFHMPTDSPAPDC